MNNFEPKATSTQYTVHVNLEDFIALSDFDFHSIPYDMGIKTFDESLEELNCFNVDYNGHFGANIFFGLERADDTPETWEAIEAVFDKYIAIAHKWQEEEEQEED
jgi:hypothetical protein